MKKLVINTLSTTCIAIIVLAVIVAYYSWDIHFYSHIFQIFVANIIIHLGLLLTSKVRIGYVVFDMLVDVAYVAVVLIAFGQRFDWFALTPIWLLILMAAGVYAVGYVLDMVRSRAEVNAINKLLQKRDKKNNKKKNIEYQGERS